MLFQAAVGIWVGMAMNGAQGLVSTRVAPGAGLGGTGGQWREARVQHGAVAALARTMWGARGIFVKEHLCFGPSS